ncbi:hypothetical protein SK128_024663, partial [Halocaridina rubra]
MELGNSQRYEEAVLRLKKLLYEDVRLSPSVSDVHNSVTKGHDDSSHHVTHLSTSSVRFTQSYTGHVREWPNGGAAVGTGPFTSAIGERSILKDIEGASGWPIELLHRQEDLIVQLEKENEFLKRELLSLGDGVQQMGKENQELSRKLTSSLAIAVNSEEESSESCSIDPTKKPGCRDFSLKSPRENEIIQVELSRMQQVLDAATEREQQALNKLREALALAEDTQSLTTQVRAGYDSALEELSKVLEATKESERELKHLLDETDQKLQEQEKERDLWRSQHQQHIKLLENQVESQNTKVIELQNDMQEKERRLSTLQEDLGVLRAAKTRLEAQLDDQRQHSKDSHARLDDIIATRSAEVSVATARARELEDHLTLARQDTSRLLQIITDMAQGTRRTVGRETDSTDDIKSERLAAEQQLSVMLSALQSRHEEELRSFQTAADHSNQIVETLQKDIASMRQQLTEENEKNSKEQERQKKEQAVLLDQLQQTQQQIVREQQQAHIHGALYQQTHDKLKKSENSLINAQQK